MVKFTLYFYKVVTALLDLDILLRLKSNDKQAFRIVFDRYRPNVYRTTNEGMAGTVKIGTYLGKGYNLTSLFLPILTL